MGKNRDYTRYSKDSIESKKPVESAEPIKPVEIEEAVENVVEPVAEPEMEVAQEPKVEEANYVTGIVKDCLKLNVREDPYPTAMILGAVAESSELIVDKAASTEDFYKVCTPVGLEGYCMKQFITIIP